MTHNLNKKAGCILPLETNTNMSVVTVILNRSAFCNVTLCTAVDRSHSVRAGCCPYLLNFTPHLPTGHPLNKITIHAPTGSQTLICHSSNVAVCTMNYPRSSMLLYFISHTRFCRFAHRVTIIAGILDTAHYLKIKKNYISQAGSPSISHLLPFST